MKAACIGRLQQGVGLHPHTKGQHIAACIPPVCDAAARLTDLRQREHDRLSIEDLGMACSKIAELPHESSVGEGLIGVVHIGRTCYRELFSRPRLHMYADAVPGVAPVAGVPARGPAWNVTAEAGYRID